MRKILLFHNLLWSKYKGEVFSHLYMLTQESEYEFNFFHIAETEDDRKSLNPVDLNYHKYPYILLFKSSYESIPKFKLFKVLLTIVFCSKSDLVILPGIHRIEYWLMLFVCKLKKTKIMVFCDSTINDRTQSIFKSTLKRIFFSLCDGVFVYGLRAQRYVLFHGMSPDRIFIRCQSHARPITYIEDKALMQRKILAPPVERPRFLYVGRLSSEKSIDTLLHAFSRVKDEYPNATLSIIGSGPIRNKLESLRDHLRLNDCVLFAGSMDIDQLSEQYLKATCLILPSISEPWGLVVNEALSFGCPVIVSDNCGCVPELVKPHITGLIFETQNALDLASKLASAPKIFSNISFTAQTCIDLVSSYSPQRSAEEMLSGCNKVLKS